MRRLLSGKGQAYVDWQLTDFDPQSVANLITPAYDARRQSRGTRVQLSSWLNDGWARAKRMLVAHLDAHPDAARWILFIPLAAVILYFELTEGSSDRLPITIAWLASYVVIFSLPGFLVKRHRKRQQKTLSRIRGLYALACEFLSQDRRAEATRLLHSIRRWERHWRIGESWLYQLAYSWFVVAVTAAVAFIHYFLYTNVNSQTASGEVPQKNLIETALFLQTHPIAFWMIVIFAVVVGLTARQHLRDLKGAAWAEFYGDRLASAIRAGRTVNEAPQHQGRELPLSATARELFGLPDRFTAAELRQAWITLARELHPDRWASAGDGVRRMKEAALKRVNAARDELAAQTVG